VASWPGFGAIARRSRGGGRPFRYCKRRPAWETFVSDWFIGCVNHDASRYKQAFEQRMNNWLQSEVRKVYGRYTVTFPRPLDRYPNLADARELLDPNEANIEFRELRDLASSAHQELAPRFANRVSTLMSAGADEIIDSAPRRKFPGSWG
jgi:hypothetical protein